MRRLAIPVLLLAALIAPAHADIYPVSGRWGQNAGPEKGAIDCKGKRVVTFNGNQRTDSGGGVPAFRNRTVTPDGGGFRVVDEFATGQITGRTTFVLRRIDADHIELALQGGSVLKLQRCK